MRWQSVFDLPGPDVDTKVYCRICGRNRYILDMANTELIPGSRCNFAYRLNCGHIMVDDCSLPSLDGRCFRDEDEWERRVVNLGERYR